MALQTSGPIALFTDIRAEEIVKTPGLSSTDFGLREVSAAAAFTEPDLMSEFYGYSAVQLATFTSNPVEIGKNDVSINIRQNSGTYDNGNGTISSRGFYFGTSTNRTSNTKYQVDTNNSTGDFSRNFTGLSGSTTYRMWAYVENEAGESASGMTSITTLATVTVTNAYGYGGGIEVYGNPWSVSANYSSYLNAWGNWDSRSCYTHPYYGNTCPDSRSVGVSTLWQHAGNLYYGQTFYTRKANGNATGNRRDLRHYGWVGGDLYGGGTITTWNPYQSRGRASYVSNNSNWSAFYSNSGCGGGFNDYGNGYNNNAGACVYHGGISYYDMDAYWQGGGYTSSHSGFGRGAHEYSNELGVNFTQN